MKRALTFVASLVLALSAQAEPYSVSDASRDLVGDAASYQGLVGFIVGAVQAEFFADPMVCVKFKNAAEYDAQVKRASSVLLESLEGRRDPSAAQKPLALGVRDFMRSIYPCP